MVIVYLILPNFLYCLSSLYFNKSTDSRACFLASFTSGEYFSAKSQTVSLTFSRISEPGQGAYRIPAIIPPTIILQSDCFQPCRNPCSLPTTIPDQTLFLPAYRPQWSHHKVLRHLSHFQDLKYEWHCLPQNILPFPDWYK